jgi:hypothetical protein
MMEQRRRKEAMKGFLFIVAVAALVLFAYHDAQAQCCDGVTECGPVGSHTSCTTSCAALGADVGVSTGCIDLSPDTCIGGSASETQGVGGCEGALA